MALCSGTTSWSQIQQDWQIGGPPNSGEFGYDPNQPLGVSPRFPPVTVAGTLRVPSARSRVNTKPIRGKTARQEPHPPERLTQTVAVDVMSIPPLVAVPSILFIMLILSSVFLTGFTGSTGWLFALARLRGAKFNRIGKSAVRQTLASSATIQISRWALANGSKTGC